MNEDEAECAYETEEMFKVLPCSLFSKYVLKGVVKAKLKK